ncbi:MAG: hypothetical protein FWC15_09390 [Fibromonadales bacterium]|nr:hypothetical protein [Fibromonadales bacterium]
MRTCITITAIFAMAFSTLIVGCANVTKKDNTLRAVELTPKAEAHQMIADLDVSDKKVMGQASGKAIFKHDLEKEAIAIALRQADGDVLVGVSYFYEFFKNADLLVTAIGYPARYKNFRPKEVENKTNVLLKGQFIYEDGSSNNLSVTVKNATPEAAQKTENAVTPVTHPAPAAYIRPATHEAVNAQEE